ncbi:MAG: MGH1-like glycoside hydrolase domain-containing protein [Acidobacteriota bacterium]
MTSQEVREGRYRAYAPSASELRSTYQSAYERRTERTITFKFAINGADNERLPGQDHHLTVGGTGRAFTSPVFVFGQSDPEGASSAAPPDDRWLPEDTDVRFRVDMRPVLEAMKTQGAFTTVTGERITPADFKGVWIAGATFPLSWNFTALPAKPEFKLDDPDGDGIYECTIHFERVTYPGRFADSVRVWHQSRDLSSYPAYESPEVLADALYRRTLEELELDKREDGAFMAGEMWPGVWTRDVSYSILLSLAAVAPDASMTTLMAKVKDGHIIQDTGTGGSWPVSSDRMVWALAAWEVFCVTGDRPWLEKSYRIIRTSADADLDIVRDPETGLIRGESSFLDWREQTYPRWMDPKDIYQSKNLGTNAVHYRTYRILAEMARVLGEDGSRYDRIASGIKDGMNRLLWQKEKGYYGQYLYGRNAMTLSPRAEALGELLSVLFGIADSAQRKELLSRLPVTVYGIPCIDPQIPNMPPYHNDAVWPFVEAFRAWSSAGAGHAEAVSHSLASIFRASALYLTNKENLVASTGDFMGTEINSSRQLWSVAGTLAAVYRVLFGMTFTPDSLSFAPFIPKAYDGTRTLKHFRYRNAVLDITVRGYGNKIGSVLLDGRTIAKPVIDGAMRGPHRLEIVMKNVLPAPARVTMAGVRIAPETPVVAHAGSPSMLCWQKIPGAISYRIYADGKKTGETRDTFAVIGQPRAFAEDLQVEAVGASSLASFLSEPLSIVPHGAQLILPAADTGFVRIERQSAPVTRTFVLDRDGTYALDVLYANGSGPINTDNKCAVRTLVIDGRARGAVVMPQRGDGLWNDWGYSSALRLRLKKGQHRLGLEFRAHDENMNGPINTALVRSFRLRRVAP